MQSAWLPQGRIQPNVVDQRLKPEGERFDKHNIVLIYSKVL